MILKRLVDYNKNYLLSSAFGMAAGVTGGAAFALQHNTLDVIWVTIATGALVRNGFMKAVKDVSEVSYASAMFGASLATAVAIGQSGLPPLMPSGFSLKLPGMAEKQATSAQQEEVTFVGRTLECMSPEPVTNDRGYPQYRLPAHCTAR